MLTVIPAEPFVDWFYNTIQGTNTNIWPEYVRLLAVYAIHH